MFIHLPSVLQTKSDSTNKYNTSKDNIGRFASGVLEKSLNDSTLYPGDTHICGQDLFGVSGA